MELSGRHLVVGMTGGIAAYKVCELVRRLQDAGATVQVVMTEGAQKFVTATTMQALSGRPVVTDQWDTASAENAMPHIALTRGAHAIVVAPATAHFMAKVAHGLADDLLTTLALARDRARTALLVAPAMNVEMWENPATQRNVAQLRADGVALLGPAQGAQACGETGHGRMLEPDELLDGIVAHFQPKLLAGRHVLLTAGPTFEAIDPVRGITNLSSGKTGFALARAARDAGAGVTLVAGPTALAAPRGDARPANAPTALAPGESPPSTDADARLMKALVATVVGIAFLLVWLGEGGIVPIVVAVALFAYGLPRLRGALRTLQGRPTNRAAVEQVFGRAAAQSTTKKR